MRVNFGYFSPFPYYIFCIEICKWDGNWGFEEEHAKLMERRV